MTNPKKKFEVLKGSYESGVIDKLEYEKGKERLEPDIKEFDNKIEEMNKTDVKDDEKDNEPKKSSEKVLLISVAVIVLLLASIFAYSVLLKPQPKTLEEMHVSNLNGKLKPEQGYIYKGVYSFITLDNLWYTQLKSPKGTKIYNLALRYSPKDLQDIAIEGSLNSDFFNSQSKFYNTFNPAGKELSYVSLAIADFSTHMSKVFEKEPVAACDRNETEPCKTRPIVTCEDSNKLVLYIKESERFRAYYNGNCIVVEGKGFELVKGVDRVLYNLYSIMGQEES